MIYVSLVLAVLFAGLACLAIDLRAGRAYVISTMLALVFAIPPFIHMITVRSMP